MIPDRFAKNITGKEFNSLFSWDLWIDFKKISSSNMLRTFFDKDQCKMHEIYKIFLYFHDFLLFSFLFLYFFFSVFLFFLISDFLAVFYFLRFISFFILLPMFFHFSFSFRGRGSRPSYPCNEMLEDYRVLNSS